MLTMFIIANIAKFCSTLKVGWKQWLLLASIVSSFIIASAWAQGGGYLLYGEQDWFLVDHNTDQRSLMSKLIAPHKHDADQYLARELTHVVEHVDAVFIHKSTMAGFPHFLSISTYGFLAAISIGFWIMAVRHGLDKVLATLLVCAFWSSPAIFMAGCAVRPGHAHSAFWATMLVLFLYHRPALSKLALGLISFGLGLAMVWADRQGLFMSAVICFTAVVTRDRDMEPILAAMIGAALAHTFHYMFTGPWLVATFTPFKVGGGYQMDVVAGMFGIIASNLVSGVRIALNNIGVMIGAASAHTAAIAVGAMAWMFGRRWWLPVSWVALASIMYALIMFHQKALILPDIMNHIYYNIFATAMFLLVIGYACSLSSSQKALRWFVAAAVVLNLIAIPGNIDAFKAGHLGGYIAGAPWMRKALKMTADMPNGTSTNRYNAVWLSHQTGFSEIMKNPIEGRIPVMEFVESSHYLQFVRGEKGLAFQKGGR